MDRRYYTAKALLIVGALAAGLAGVMMPQSGGRNSVAHLHYGFGARVEAAVLRSSAKVSLFVVEILHRVN